MRRCGRANLGESAHPTAARLRVGCFLAGFLRWNRLASGGRCVASEAEILLDTLAVVNDDFRDDDAAVTLGFGAHDVTGGRQRFDTVASGCVGDDAFLDARDSFCRRHNNTTHLIAVAIDDFACDRARRMGVNRGGRCQEQDGEEDGD